ncbi:hypothetical protein FFM54_14750 [Burkholderia pseudomallei]|nr:hypothetical protein FFM54_14750 [Burkholderia pseudomallei]
MRGRRRNRGIAGMRSMAVRGATYTTEHRRSPARAIDADQRSATSRRFARADWCGFVANRSEPARSPMPAADSRVRAGRGRARVVAASGRIPAVTRSRACRHGVRPMKVSGARRASAAAAYPVAPRPRSRPAGDAALQHAVARVAAARRRRGRGSAEPMPHEGAARSGARSRDHARRACCVRRARASDESMRRFEAMLACNSS